MITLPLILVGLITCFRVRQVRNAERPTAPPSFDSPLGYAFGLVCLIGLACTGSTFRIHDNGHHPFRETYVNFLFVTLMFGFLFFIIEALSRAARWRPSSAVQSVEQGCEVALTMFAFGASIASSVHFDARDRYCATPDHIYGACASYRVGVFCGWTMLWLLVAKGVLVYVHSQDPSNYYSSQQRVLANDF